MPGVVYDLDCIERRAPETGTPRSSAARLENPGKGTRTLTDAATYTNVQYNIYDEDYTTRFNRFGFSVFEIQA